jgi:hypothetical protein
MQVVRAWQSLSPHSYGVRENLGVVHAYVMTWLSASYAQANNRKHYWLGTARGARPIPNAGRCKCIHTRAVHADRQAGR